MQRKKKINIIGLEKYSNKNSHSPFTIPRRIEERKKNKRKEERSIQRKKETIDQTLNYLKRQTRKWIVDLDVGDERGEKKSMATFNGGHRVRDGVTRCRLDVWRVAEGTVPPPFPDATLHAVRFSPCPRGVLSSH